MIEFDESIVTSEFTPLSESEVENLRTELEFAKQGLFSMGERMSELKNLGYRIAFNSNFPQYLRAAPVRSGGGAIIAAGMDHFIFQLPGQPRMAVPYGIILLQLP
ncbi:MULTISPECIES: hypothetical protein [Pacificibacter]|uniref:hypothetical protein n=1 Tax=Pacificibacter TaxID=1042323 RepID=UPI001C08CCE7|nr:MULTISPECIES: hypothetical protein [Pacificibacter]MBU2937854.1 hypothetical protein [Pacificibacter marinus]MDO6616115.1 hypothetical protein [Pacificibacter sp. 1_MG-2023]